MGVAFDDAGAADDRRGADAAGAAGAPSGNCDSESMCAISLLLSGSGGGIVLGQSGGKAVGNVGAALAPGEGDGLACDGGRVRRAAGLRVRRRVLRDDGRLVFSYHHSREDGWTAVATAILGAGFSLIQSPPVKSEMSVASPKSQAKEPIDLDVLLVCRKKQEDNRPKVGHPEAMAQTEAVAEERVSRFNRSERRLSRNDVRVILLSQLLVELSPGRDCREMAESLETLLAQSKESVERIWAAQTIYEGQEAAEGEGRGQQLALFK